LVVIRLILDPLASRETRQALNQMDGFRGDFDRVHVSILNPGYDITRLELFEVPPGDGRGPGIRLRPPPTADRRKEGGRSGTGEKCGQEGCGSAQGPARQDMTSLFRWNRAFQRDKSLPATGVPDDLTVQNWGSIPVRFF
jgi:hypothetical protein